MTHEKTYTTQAFCLKTYDFGEADKVLHLYSPDYGRISAIAKGVKRQKSKLAGACELLHLSEVHLSKGKNLDTLLQYQSIESFSAVRTDILKLAYASLFAELLNLVATEHDLDSHALFALLETTLHELEPLGGEAEEVVPLALHFQTSLLEASGFHPHWHACMATHQPLDSGQLYYSFSSHLGGVVHPNHTDEFPGHRWVPVSTRTLMALSGQSDIQSINLLKAQKFLRFCLTETLERPIKAFDFVLQLLGESP